MTYRAFGGLKQMSYANGRNLSLAYNNRMFLTQWSIPGVMGWNYAYNYFNENTGRVVYAQNLNDPTLDRAYDYDHVGRPTHFTSGSNARHFTGQGGSVLNDGPYSQGYSFDVWGNRTYIEGWGGIGRLETTTYTNNRRNGFTYDAAGNVTNDQAQTFTYDVTGQQATASYSGYSLQQIYLAGIKRLAEAYINTENGAKFAQTILDQLSKGGPTLSDVFNAFFNQKHDLFTRNQPAGSRGEATALGSLKKATATMFLSAHPSLQTTIDANNVVQELFHFAGKEFKGIPTNSWLEP